jgi:hypothetical protein
MRLLHHFGSGLRSRGDGLYIRVFSDAARERCKLVLILEKKPNLIASQRLLTFSGGTVDCG